jgi:hypothetical protein
MKQICPIRFDRPCLNATCGWYDMLHDHCMIITIGAKLFDLTVNTGNIAKTYRHIVSPELDHN